MAPIIKKEYTGKGHPSFSTRVLLFAVFLPLTCLFIAINSYISFTLTVNQLRESAIESTSYVVVQSRNYFDSNLKIILDSFLLLDLKNQKEIDFCSVAPNDYSSYQQYLLEMRKQIDLIHFSFYEQLDSALIYIDKDDTLLYKSISIPISYQVNTDNLKQYAGKGYVWKYLYPDEYPLVTNETKSNVLSILKIFNSKYQKSAGIIQYNLKPEYFVDLLNNSDQLINCELLIMADDRIVNPDFENDTVLSAEIVQHISENPGSATLGSFLYKQRQGESFLIIYNTSLVNGWKIVALIPYANLVERAKAVTMMSIRNFAILIIISALLISIAVGMITRPIVSLVKKVAELEDKSLDITFYSNSILREINFLNQGINHLVEHAKKLLAEVQKEQEEKHQAEFVALSAQINPHFLYNTLFSAKQLCDMGDCESAGNMVMALSNFYRASIKGGGSFISLKNEFILTENYIEIHRQKYTNTFTYSVNLPPPLEECIIIKMTLQPIVENAIYHGLTSKEGDKKISIHAVLDNNDILITICDNGIGILPDKLSAIKQKINEAANSTLPVESPMVASSRRTGIGLINVHKRIITYYGSAYGLNIESFVNEGTRVIIRIPAVYPNSVN